MSPAGDRGRQGGQRPRETGVAGDASSRRAGESAGLYVHIPFCTGKCGYCDFFSIPFQPERAERTVAALKGEIGLRAGEWSGERIRIGTVYFGGGTPSLLSPETLEGILSAASTRLPWAAPEELTIEVNPGRVSLEWFAGVRRIGFDRVSIGVQSFSDDDLVFLGRRHTAAEAGQAYAWAREAGFGNVSIDLIYGLPGQSVTAWERTLRVAVGMRPDHVSAYELTVAPGTPLARSVERGEVRRVDESVATEMFLRTPRILAEAGLHRYEVSNFSRKGMESRHNMLYWAGGRYLGIGPGAHSHQGNRRWWNVNDVNEYVGRVGRGEPPTGGSETLSPEEMNRERILLSLRTSEGVSLTKIAADKMRVVRDLGRRGLLEVSSGRVRLTEHGFLLADEVAVSIA